MSRRLLGTAGKMVFARGNGGLENRLHAASAIGLVLVCAVAPAFAQSQPITLPPVSVEETAPLSGAVDGYTANVSRSSTRTDTPLIDVPQSISVVTQDAIKDQGILSIGDAIRYVPGITQHQGESNRDQVIIRGNSSSADFFIDGARDDVQFFRDLYNIDRVEVLKGPNAMAFGRGGSGGVINRVSKEADGSRIREVILSGGSYDNKRLQVDVGEKLMDTLAVRLNGVYEDSGTFRQYGDLERYGIAPTATIDIQENTRVRVGYEHFHDRRFNDRGIPSFNGAPFSTDPSTFFGNPRENFSVATVDSGYAILEHDFGSDIKLRNYTRYADYGKLYQNVYAGSAVSAAGTLSIVGYNNGIDRQNFTNQSDLTGNFETGSISHTVLIGAEIATQDSRALRNTAFFNNATTSITVPASNPVTSAPVTYRQSATDANNHSEVHVFAGYVQDQIKVTDYLQIVGGVRFDRFKLSFHDNRTGTNLSRTDHLVSPRAGVVLKPSEALSVYGSYSVTYLPSAGDQFATLTAQTQGLKPEKLENYEVGAKWDVIPRLNVTLALYQLDRNNTRATDPADPTKVVPTGASRTRGIELGVAGHITDQWQVTGGYAFQEALIKKTTTAARAGAKVALVPQNTFSLWNKYDITPMWGAAIGVVHQSHQFAAVDDTVRLKGFTRADAAVYFKLNEMWRLQVNVENIFDTKYVLTADGNNNISPGSPIAARAALTVNF